MKPLEELTDEDWQLQWELNVMAPMRLMRAFAPAMAKAGDGRMVNVSSSSGKRPSLRNTAYSVGKAAELSLSRAFADSYAGAGRPRQRGGARAGRHAALAGDGRARGPGRRGRGRLRERGARERCGRRSRSAASAAEEMAAAIVFLCSGRAASSPARPGRRTAGASRPPSKLLDYAAAAPSGSGRTTTVSAIGMTSSTGSSAEDACSRTASALDAW